MATVLLAIGFIAIFFVLMSVRLIFIKDGKFKGTCASQREEGGTCGLCGDHVNAGESCKSEQGKSAIQKVFSKL